MKSHNILPFVLVVLIFAIGCQKDENNAPESPSYYVKIVDDGVTKIIPALEPLNAGGDAIWRYDDDFAGLHFEAVDNSISGKPVTVEFAGSSNTRLPNGIGNYYGGIGYLIGADHYVTAPDGDYSTVSVTSYSNHAIEGSFTCKLVLIDEPLTLSITKTITGSFRLRVQ